MPYDTVIDKAQLESAITASANAIREKTGDTALIEWLSDKGFAEAIAGIESGGMDLSQVGFTKASCGSITPADSSSKTITHNLGVIPKLIMVFTNDDVTVLATAQNSIVSSLARTFTDPLGDEKTYYVALSKSKTGTSFTGLSNKIASGAHEAKSGNFVVGPTYVKENSFVIQFSDGGNTKYNLLAGVTYFWFCLG